MCVFSVDFDSFLIPFQIVKDNTIAPYYLYYIALISRSEEVFNSFSSTVKRRSKIGPRLTRYMAREPMLSIC